MFQAESSGISKLGRTRKRSNNSATYMELAEKCVKQDDGKFRCGIDPHGNCQYSQVNYEAGNMIRHFRLKHTALAESLGITKGQPTINKQRTILKRLVAVDKRLVLEASMKLVTKHHLPLRCFEWEGLKMLLEPLASAVGINISRANMKLHLQNAAEKVKAVISKEASDKLISLMLDSASRHGRHILGISVQYSVNDKLVIRTLAMMEIHERQTASFLKDRVLDVLQSYGIRIDQVFSVTTDNGSNMLATVKKLQTALEQSICDTLFMEEFEDDSAAETFVERISDELDKKITLVRCSVHTLQLAINDVFSKIDPNMKAITDIIKTMKQIRYKPFIEMYNIKKPPIWSPTRWGGKHKMLSCVLKQESQFNALGAQFPELSFIDEQMQFIKDYVAITKPLYECTIKMQSVHYPLSQFYLDWLIAIKQVKGMHLNPFSEALVTALNNRLEKLRDNLVFKASLYLDPRFNFLNSSVFRKSEEKEEVQKFIIDTWSRIASLNSPSDNDNSTQASVNESIDDTDEFFTEMFGGSVVSESSSMVSFHQQLRALEVEPRQTYLYDVWNHWVARKKSHPELYAVAMIILATPSTQVTVERAFSALAIVLSDLRTGLAEDTLANILLIKLNMDIAEKVMADLYQWKDDLPSLEN